MSADTDAGTSDRQTCDTCGEDKPHDRKHFEPRVSGDGLRTTCRKCRNRRKYEREKKRDAGRKRVEAGTRAIVVLSDVHCEMRHRALWDNYLDWQSDNTGWLTDLVMAGDFLELISASRYGHEAIVGSYLDDLAVGRACLDDLRRAGSDKLNKVQLRGNHEGRIDKLIDRVAPSLKGAVLSIADGLQLRERGIRWVESNRQPYESTFGRLRLIHGDQLRGGGQYKAAKLAREVAHPGELAACGHFHRLDIQMLPCFGMPNEYKTGMTLPTMRSLRPGYIEGPDGWTLGFVVFYVDPSGAVQPMPVIANAHGQFHFGAKFYSKRADQ